MKEPPFNIQMLQHWANRNAPENPPTTPLIVEVAGLGYHLEVLTIEVLHGKVVIFAADRHVFPPELP